MSDLSIQTWEGPPLIPGPLLQYGVWMAWLAIANVYTGCFLSVGSTRP